MAVRNPGFDNSAGSRGRRVNRFAAAGDNDADKRHLQITGIAIGFSAPDGIVITTATLITATTISFTATATISDSDNGFGIFAIGDKILIAGSGAEDGVYTVATAAAGVLTVSEAGIATVVAGPSITITKLGVDLDKFVVGSFIEIEGSAGQDGTYEVDAGVTPGHLQTVEQTITTEAAGASMRVKSTNNRNVNRFS